MTFPQVTKNKEKMRVCSLYNLNHFYMMNKSSCNVHKLAEILVWVGALNWGLVGFFNWNLVNSLLGNVGEGTLEMVIYMLVGLSAVAMLFSNNCKMCKK